MAAVGPFSRILATSVKRGRLGLVHLVKFLMVELIHPCLNHKFDMSIVFTVNYFFSRRRHFHQQRDVFDDRFYKSQDQADSVFQMYS
jgi:hypothetical protein